MSIVLFIAVLVVLIVVHELGHFLIAKLFRIRVDEFGIGYPPRAFTLGTHGDTTYTLNWLPFGGFVRIFGERHNRAYSSQEKEQAFVYKPRIVQAAVLAGGVVFNVLFAWLLFTATFLIGTPMTIDESEAAGVDTRLVVSSVIAGSPADVAGLVAGDEIVSLRSGEQTLADPTPETASAFIQARPGEDVVISYVRDLEARRVEAVRIIPAHGVLSESPGTPAVGIAMALVTDRALPLGEALTEGLTATAYALKAVTVGLLGFFASALTGTVDWAQVAGPIGIAGLVGEASSVGLVYLLYFTAFISINLAIINLLPLPALDGGRLVFVAIEALLRKPINERITTALNVVGFALIIFLMVVVTYHDILNLAA